MTEEYNDEISLEEPDDVIDISSLGSSSEADGKAEKASIEFSEDASEGIEDDILAAPYDELDAEILLENDLEEDVSALIVSGEETIDEKAELEGVTHLDRLSEMKEQMSLEAQVEAIIFAAPKSMKTSEITEIIAEEDLTVKDVQNVIDNLIQYYDEKAGGFRLELIRGGGYQFRTLAVAAPLMEKIFSSRPRPISKAAQETLSIVAYRQPVTRADVEFIRGVDAGSIIKNLLERDLIKCVGRKEDAGRPMLFGTTEEFLRVYQLGSLKDLPPLSSFQPASETIQKDKSNIDEELEAVDVEGFIDNKGTGEAVPQFNFSLEDEGFSAEVDPEEEDMSLPIEVSSEGEEVGIEIFNEEAESPNAEARAGAEFATDFDEEMSIAEENLENTEEIDGTDKIAEVDLTTGDSFETGSGEMDN